MTGILVRLVVFAALLVAPARAGAQAASTRTSLSGLVTSQDGGPVAGATVTLASESNGWTVVLTTNTVGVFSAPALDIGSYSVSVSQNGFKTLVIRHVRAAAGAPAHVRAQLDLGNRTEFVEVVANADLVPTRSNTISTTLTSEQIQRLPFLTRNVVNALTILPGVDTIGGPRATTVNGLPQSAVNITYDGVSVRDSFGFGSTTTFYSSIEPTFDAVEEATVTTAVPAADSAAQGAVTARFMTRAGTSAFRGTAYNYFRHPGLNSRAFFRELEDEPKDRVTLFQFGASEGGPIRRGSSTIPRGFFFINFEEFRQRLATTTRTRTILTPAARRGLFSYNTAGGATQTVDMLKIAAAAGHASVVDPTIGALLDVIDAAAASTGSFLPSPNPNTSRYTFQSNGAIFNHLLTGRVDYDVRTGHRFTATYHWQEYNRSPDVQAGGDPSFPGLPVQASFRSPRQKLALQWRSVVSPSAVGEIQGGFHRLPAWLSDDLSADSFANQKGFDLAFPLGATSATARNQSGYLNTPNWNVDATLNWLKGPHGMKFGVSFTQIDHVSRGGSIAPSIQFGIDQQDPAGLLFMPQNFPGMALQDFGAAMSLYAFLTGRVTAINATAGLDDNGVYVYNHPEHHNVRMREAGFFVQDEWRVTPTLTANFGVRWEVELPMTPRIDSYSVATVTDVCGVSGVGPGVDGRGGCNYFQRGVLPGPSPVFRRFEPGTSQYGTELANFAPNAGVAWQPGVRTGWLRRVLGDPTATTIRVGAGLAFTRESMAEFVLTAGPNPGRSVPASRNSQNGNLVLPGERWPVLLAETSRLGPPKTCQGPTTPACVPATPVYPMPATVSNNIAAIDPNLRVPSALSFTAGLERLLSPSTSLEIRYVGSRYHDEWVTENWNETDFVDNGFLAEFQSAQSNLAANMAANRGITFAYFGPDTGTSPLPILFAHFEGQPQQVAGDPTRYRNDLWRSPLSTSLLNPLNPDPRGFEAVRLSPVLRANALAAGLPVNFWVVNPDVASTLVKTNGGSRAYDSLQIDLRRRMSNGLFLTANYVYAKSDVDTSVSLFRPYVKTRNSRGVPQVFKFTASYEMPFGRGRRFGSNLGGWKDALAGGWSTSFAGIIRGGQRVTLSRVRLVGMTEKELNDAFAIRLDRAGKAVYTLPQEIIDNTVRAYSTNLSGYALGAPTGRYIEPAGGPGCAWLFPGDCGETPFIYLAGPVFSRVDMNVRKRIAIGREKSLDIQVDIFNLFDAINFIPVLAPSASPTFAEVTSAYSDLGTTYDPGGRLGQVAIRLNW